MAHEIKQGINAWINIYPANRERPGSMDLAVVHLPYKTILSSEELVGAANELLNSGLGNHSLLVSVTREPGGNVQIAELIYRVGEGDPRVVCLASRMLAET